VMVMGWPVLRACVVTIYKRSYDMPFDVNPKQSNQEAVDEPDPLSPLRVPPECREATGASSRGGRSTQRRFKGVGVGFE